MATYVRVYLSRLAPHASGRSHGRGDGGETREAVAGRLGASLGASGVCRAAGIAIGVCAMDESSDEYFFIAGVSSDAVRAGVRLHSVECVSGCDGW